MLLQFSRACTLVTLVACILLVTHGPLRAHALLKDFELTLGPADTPEAAITTLVEHFGFAKNGHVRVTLTELRPPSASVYFVLFSRSQWDQGVSARRLGVIDHACTLPGMMRVEMNGRSLVSGGGEGDASDGGVPLRFAEIGERYSSNFTYCVPQANDYMVTVIYCKKTVVHVAGQLSLTNPPGNTHLSLELSGLQPLYVMLVAVYGILTVIWGIVMIRYVRRG